MSESYQESILTYAKQHLNQFEECSRSSNQIFTFPYRGKEYVLKLPLMNGANNSPFWVMMEQVFGYTVAAHNAKLPELYKALQENPHLPVAPFVVADKDIMIFEFVEGGSWEEDQFPLGTSAYQLGQYIGFNHQSAHTQCGVYGVEDVSDFFATLHSHIERCLASDWNGKRDIDRRVQAYYETWKERPIHSEKFSLIMADISADQFLYQDGKIVSCVDLDAYVIGPVEWELTFLRKQIVDWNLFRVGYETYQKLPTLEETSQLYSFVMALNAPWDEQEMANVIQ